MTASRRRAPDKRTLEDWLAHIQAQHWRTIDLTLERIARVWARLGGSPGDSGLGRVISVAGTNGKGSCVAMLEAALRAAGWRVGSYTSPHLVRYNERIRVDGRAADDADLCAAFAEIEGARDGIPLTYFEFGTLCALLIFRRRRVDASLLEVGMGGRQDAVNLIHNDIALITSVGIDHAQWLGLSRENIAAEKAGILKSNAMAVCAEPRPPECIARIAAERNCALLQNGADYTVEGLDNGIRWRSGHPAVPERWRRIEGLRLPLNGAQQVDNLGGVAAVLALTQGADTGAAAGFNITPQNLADGLAKTRLAGRCQVIGGADGAGGKPEIILDVAHNPDSAAGLAAFLERRKTPGKTRGVLGILADKPVAEIFAALDGVIDHWYLATLAGERGQSAQAVKAQLAAAAGGAGNAGNAANATTHDSPVAACLRAMAEAGGGDRVVIFGSFYTVGAIIAHFRHDEEWPADLR